MGRINTNVEALISRRAIGINNRALNKALERRSTGLRINSGKDDPAGLIASETLRSSIRAISSAIDNANRADTIVSVAEGGLQEVSSLLLELENLIDQTANKSGLTPEEVSANQLQIDAILESIDRLSQATAFGSKKLLNGTLDFTTSGVNVIESTGAAVSHLASVKVNSARLHGSFRSVNISVVKSRLRCSFRARRNQWFRCEEWNAGQSTTIQITGNYGTDTLSFTSGATAVATTINLEELTGVWRRRQGRPAVRIAVLQAPPGRTMVSVSILENASTAFVSQAATATKYGVNGTVTVNGANAAVNGLDASVRTGGLSMDFTLTPTFGGTTGGTTSFEITGGGAVFSISPEVGLSGQESIGIAGVAASSMGNTNVGFLSTLRTGLTNDLSSENFATAQRIVRAAINQIASLRGRLGAFQKNTLQSTINSLQVARENVTAAESAIRDADFAVETSNLTRAQILVSSSTTVLRLANAQPQNALSLLQ